MWVIFLLSALGFGIIALILCFAGSILMNAINIINKITDSKINEIEKENNNKKENEENE